MHLRSIGDSLEFQNWRLARKLLSCGGMDPTYTNGTMPLTPKIFAVWTNCKTLRFDAAKEQKEIDSLLSPSLSLVNLSDIKVNTNFKHFEESLAEPEKARKRSPRLRHDIYHAHNYGCIACPIFRNVAIVRCLKNARSTPRQNLLRAIYLVDRTWWTKFRLDWPVKAHRP